MGTIAAFAALGVALSTVEFGRASVAAAWTDASGPSNPCKGPMAAKLLCPDLTVSPPSNLYISKQGGHRLLHATNSINSRGRGPIELLGIRKPGHHNKMDAYQRIHKVGGGVVRLPSRGGKLLWKAIPGQDHYWKFLDAVRWELWKLDGQHDLVRRVRVGAKKVYCLRDLLHTAPGRPHSPHHRVYPKCNQKHRIRRDILGISVGWSDAYPSNYFQQWIDVTGLRGCYALRFVVDPEHHLWQSNDQNDTSRAIVRLPKGKRGGC